jgi:hypothetical protein
MIVLENNFGKSNMVEQGFRRRETAFSNYLFSLKFAGKMLMGMMIASLIASRVQVLAARTTTKR